METPMVMGILNLTPDSFYDGGKYKDDKAVIKQAEKMAEDGASIIDVGGQSTRPGSSLISAKEECARVIHIIELIRKHLPDLIISIDTFYAQVARAAIEAGSDMINDISAGSMDPDMFQQVSELKVPYILMHMRGTPQTMTDHTDYKDLMGEIIKYFEQKLNKLRDFGVNDIILDPGFGFAKNVNQNFKLLANLQFFNIFSKPLLVGVSRKSMIFRTLGVTAEDSLNGTTVLNTIALMNGASILRVHDVRQAVEAIKLVKELKI